MQGGAWKLSGKNNIDAGYTKDFCIHFTNVAQSIDQVVTLTGNEKCKNTLTTKYGGYYYTTTAAYKNTDALEPLYQKGVTPAKAQEPSTFFNVGAGCPITNCYAYDGTITAEDKESTYVSIEAKTFRPMTKNNDWQGLMRKIRYTCTNGPDTVSATIQTYQDSICKDSIVPTKDTEGNVIKPFHQLTQNTTVGADAPIVSGKWEESGYRAIDPYTFLGYTNPNPVKCPIKYCQLQKAGTNTCSSFTLNSSFLKYDGISKMI